MNEKIDLDDSSVVEYSLAELGFVLVFVLLLLSGWEINSNLANQKQEQKNLAELSRQLEVEKKETQTLKKLIAWLPPETTEFPDDFMFVDKKEYLALQATAENARQAIEKISPTMKDIDLALLSVITDIASSIEPLPDDPMIVSIKEQSKLEEALAQLRAQNSRMIDQLTENVKTSDTSDGGKVGTIGFCTYELPKPGSKKVYGKSVALGTLLVEEDGVTLMAKNDAIQNRDFVDIAGEVYDTSLVASAIDQWPLRQKLSPGDFRKRGARFVEIGDLPSSKRVACRFGMDYYLPVYSEASFSMLKNVVEGSFYKNAIVSETRFLQLFPKYDFTSNEDITEPRSSENKIISAGTRTKLP